MAVEVVRAAERSRYEIRVDGQLAGFAEYELGEDRITLVHTEIDDAYGGQGLGKRLARDAVADATRRAERIVPLCPFIARYLRRHEVPGAAIEWPARSVRGDSPHTDRS